MRAATIARIGVGIFTAAGAVLTATLPRAIHHRDLRFMVDPDAVGPALLLGLLLAYTGTTIIQLSTPRKDPRVSTRQQPTVHPIPTRAVQTGQPAWVEGHPERPLQDVVPQHLPLPYRRCGNRL